jgi:hypothetical protein
MDRHEESNRLLQQRVPDAWPALPHNVSCLLYKRLVQEPSSAIAYIGDNEQRDMKPAMAERILAELKPVSFDTRPPQMNTLRKLERIGLD